MTAYNPAVVVLNNMLREQIRLVEQFVEINQRMYESYSSGLNNNYRYTTLEDTQQVYCLTIIPRAQRVVQYSQIDSIGVSGDKKGLHWYQWYDWYQ